MIGFYIETYKQSLMPSTFLHERPTDESHSPILPVRSLQLMPLPFFASKKWNIELKQNFILIQKTEKKVILQVGDASDLSKYCVGPQLILFIKINAWIANKLIYLYVYVQILAPVGPWQLKPKLESHSPGKSEQLTPPVFLFSIIWIKFIKKDFIIKCKNK